VVRRFGGRRLPPGRCARRQWLWPLLGLGILHRGGDPGFDDRAELLLGVRGGPAPRRRVTSLMKRTPSSRGSAFRGSRAISGH
jgi:hypothetical protein